jgi:hypothetical protein
MFASRDCDVCAAYGVVKTKYILGLEESYFGRHSTDLWHTGFQELECCHQTTRRYLDSSSGKQRGFRGYAEYCSGKLSEPGFNEDDRNPGDNFPA